jgi:adenosylcobyric acid synthase
MKGIMLQGTSSDVGKSLLATALCRIFYNSGYRTAPFKSQNMSNNSYVTIDDKEIGRAQGLQAEAANTEATVYMNPILLKPRNDLNAEVVLLGESYQTFSGIDYRKHFYELGLGTIEDCLQKLKQEFDLIVIEGAGSPVEINLNDRELVNMKVAEIADVPVILVADIERGGVFASIVGTLELLTEQERRRVQGIIINKFRGDLSLFENGVAWLEEKTGIKVIGVIPYLQNHSIENEDSLSLNSRLWLGTMKPIDIVVMKLPYISNYTDIEPFLYEEDVSIRLVEHADQFGEPDAVIIPGTRSSINDLEFLKSQSLDTKIKEFVGNGGTIIGICGGFQMLCRRLLDKAGTDTGKKNHVVQGLGILPMKTEFELEKKTTRSQGQLHDNTGFSPIRIEGYEIHLGSTTPDPLTVDFSPFIITDNGSEGVCLEKGKVIGTYFHHLFHHDEWRNAWLNKIREHKGMERKEVLQMEEKKDIQYNQLAEHVQQHLDIDYLIDIITNWEKQRNEASM